MKTYLKPIVSAYLSFFTVTAIWITGGLLNLIPWTKPAGEPISISLVQGNIPQSLKWSPEHVQLSLDRYEKLTEPLWGKNKLIIWPEAAIPLSLLSATDYIEMLDAKAKKNDSELILGIPIPSEKNDGYYNGIVTLGKKKQVYIKRHLVPFGEYTPSLPLFTQALNFMKIPLPNMMPGKMDQRPLEFNHVKILTSICYEIAFPELINTNKSSLRISPYF